MMYLQEGVQAMELNEFDKLLQAHLGPMREALDKLERNQEKIVDILTTQARHDEIIRHLEDNVRMLHKENETMFSEIKKCGNKSNKRIWDLVMAAILITGTAIATYIISK